MAFVVKQTPGYLTMAAGQQIIYVISDDTSVMTTELMVKVNAQVQVNRLQSMNPAGTIHSSSYSSTPNSAGVCIFDFGKIIENYVTPQYNGVISDIPSTASSFQGVDYSEDTAYHSIHNIDKYCLAPEPVNYFSVILTLEYLGADPNFPNQVNEAVGYYNGTPVFFTYNGVIYNTDKLSYVTANDPSFGYDLATNEYILMGKALGHFLTDMPLTFEARVEDYGTVAFFNLLDPSDYTFETQGASSDEGVDYMMIKCWDGVDGTGSQIGLDITVTNRQTNGGWSGISPDLAASTTDTQGAKLHYLFAGVYPANLRGWSSTFQAAVAGGTMASYTIQPVANPGSYCGMQYTCNIISGDCRYESIRLAWLNKHGAWDYYTFTKKSVRTLTSKHTQYKKLDGTWNEGTFSLNKNQGGRKNFKTNTTEKIRINTNYINEETAVWLEQLQTSNEVMIIKDYFAGGTMEVIRAFTEPCTLTSTSFTKKTVGNDKLIQYTFEIEKAVEIKSQGA